MQMPELLEMENFAHALVQVPLSDPEVLLSWCKPPAEHFIDVARGTMTDVLQVLQRQLFIGVEDHMLASPRPIQPGVAQIGKICSTYLANH